MKGDITIEEVQRSLSQLLLSSELADMEKLSKKYDNDLELVIYTLSPSNQIDGALKVLNEVITYMKE